MSESGASSGADLCIVVAVDIEFKIAAGLLSGKSFTEEPRMKICRGLFGGRRVTILQSGMGAAGFAEGLSNHLANNSYDALIVAGLAGGLDPNLRVGDIVLYDLCYDARGIDLKRRGVDHRFGHFTAEAQRTQRLRGEEEAEEEMSLLPSARPQRSPRLCGESRPDGRNDDQGPRRERPDCEDVAAATCDKPLSDRLHTALINSGFSLVRAPGITAGSVVTKSKEKLALGAHYGAAAVDMETYETLSACARLGLSAAALRVISDEAGRDIPDFNRIYKADGRINGLGLAAAIIARPTAAFRLLLTVRRALQSLRASLQVAMSA